MNERRLDTRRMINTNVRLYHPVLGRIDGVTRDISGGGVAIKLNLYKKLKPYSLDRPLLFRPLNLDTLFPVECIRQAGTKLVLKFLK